MLLENPSTIPSASIAVADCFQFKKQLCSIPCFFDSDLWQIEQ